MRTGATLALTLLAAFVTTPGSAQTVIEPKVNPANYAPVNVTCPSTSLLRASGTVPDGNQTINPNEALFIETRRQGQVADRFQQLLANNLTGYDLNELAPNASYWPTVGLAVSGGGFRAALVGAGTFQALDARNSSSIDAGTGGVLQLASYMTGLSGGSWFISSLAVNNIPPIEDLVLGGNGYQGWFLEYNLVLPDGLISFGDNQDYYNNLGDNVQLKERAGFNTSITDVWGVALAYHFGPGGTTGDNFYNQSTTQHNTPVQWGDIRNVSNFEGYGMPFPAIVADSRPPNYFPIELNLSTVYIPLNSTVYEFNPYEFGSWDVELAHWLPLDYVGTNLFKGQPLNSTACVNGFSNFGYTIGTSSSLFNAIIQTANATLLGLGDGSGIIEGLLDDVLANIGLSLRNSEDDLAIYPNPFNGINPGRFPRSNDDQLQLVDGGEAGANIPLDPLLVKARKVDTIVAVDGSADTDQNWPNGTALRASYARSKTLPDGQQTLPYFPSGEVFVDQGLNQRPTFFGCNASQSEIDDGMPFIIYLPNSPNTGGYLTNASTYTLGFSRDDTQSFLNSMWTTTTRGYPESGQSTDSQWGACFACALVERKRQSRNITRSSVCEQCFTRYCYDAGPSSTSAQSSLALFADVPDLVYSDDEDLHA